MNANNEDTGEVIAETQTQFMEEADMSHDANLFLTLKVHRINIKCWMSCRMAQAPTLNKS
jgi:hypothetical protein